MKIRLLAAHHEYRPDHPSQPGEPTFTHRATCLFNGHLWEFDYFDTASKGVYLICARCALYARTFYPTANPGSLGLLDQPVRQF